MSHRQQTPRRRNATALAVAGTLGTSALAVVFVAGMNAQAATAGGLITGGSGKCLGLVSGSTADGTRAALRDCDGSTTQKWSLPGDGTIRAAGKCLDVAAAKTADGTAVQLYNCNGTKAQQWKVTSGATIVNPAANKCLDVVDRSTANKAKLQIWTCTGGTNQKWTLASGGGTPTGPTTSTTKATTPTATSATPPTATTKTTTSTSTTKSTTSTASARPQLTDPAKKEIAMKLVSSAENSSLDWKAQYGYLQDIGDGRGYTGGIIGFCSGTGDMLELVEAYAAKAPGAALVSYLPALRAVDGTDSHSGLGSGFESAWRTAAKDPLFQAAQDAERDRVYFNPSVTQAQKDGLGALGQFAYYDAIVMHGPGNDGVSFGGIRATALKKAKTPAQGGDEKTFISAFLDARKAAMLTEEAHSDTDRVDTEQRVFLNAGNLDLNPPLSWSVYGDKYTIAS